MIAKIKHNHRSCHKLLTNLNQLMNTKIDHKLRSCTYVTDTFRSVNEHKEKIQSTRYYIRYS